MDSKERIQKACNHQRPDRIPLDYWATEHMTAELLNHFKYDTKEELLKDLDVDLRYLGGPEYTGPPLKTMPDGSREDIWGIFRKSKRTSTGAVYDNVTKPPLAGASTVKDIENYKHWPSIDWFDFSGLKAEKFPNRALVFSGGRLNRTSQLKQAIYLRGMQQTLEDMYTAPELFEALLEKIVSFYLEFNQRLFEAIGEKLDIFMMGDDFGMQDNLFCSKEKWNRFFRPGLKKFIDQAKNFDLLVMHHSCGAIEPLIPDLIDLGLDILNPIQPEARGMEPEKLKEKYGTHLTFHGGVSVQRLLPHGNPQEVKEKVKELVDILGVQGGYILCTAHNLQPDIPIHNIEALFDAYTRYR